MLCVLLGMLFSSGQYHLVCDFQKLGEIHMVHGQPALELLDAIQAAA